MDNGIIKISDNSNKSVINNEIQETKFDEQIELNKYTLEKTEIKTDNIKNDNITEILNRSTEIKDDIIDNNSSNGDKNKNGKKDIIKNLNENDNNIKSELMSNFKNEKSNEINKKTQILKNGNYMAKPNVHQNENVDINDKKEVKKRIKKNHINLKRTSVSTIQPLIIRKGATSNFLKGNTSFLNEGNDVSLDPEKNYSDVIVIHPGSRYLRIGKASDAFPIQIPHCIARDITPINRNFQSNNMNNNQDIKEDTVPEGENNLTGNDKMEGIEINNINDTDINNNDEHTNKRRKGNDSLRINADTDSDSSNNTGQRRSLRSKNRHKNTDDDDVDDDDDAKDNYIYSDELIINKEYIKKLETDIKFRMRLAKMRVTPNAHSQVQQYNIQSIPEIIPDHNDPYKIEWTSTENHEKYFVGLKALRLKSYVKKDTNIIDDLDPHYQLYFPIKNGTFNLEDYDNLRVVLGDIERIWSYVIINELSVKRNEFKNYNVVLVIPDIYEKVYVVELINLLLKEMNFKAIIVQQESSCAAFGAGFSMSCIVDIGAQKTSISCIEDGFCIPETRLNLKYGGDDITKLFMALLIHNSFPYSEIDLTRIYDWQLAQELKERFCTVIESDLTCRVYTFYVRVPDKDTRVYSLKVYDEVVMAPMLLFNTHMINFKKKFSYLIDKEKNYMDKVSVEEIVRLNDHIKLQNQSHINNNTQTNNMDAETNSEYQSPNTSSTVNIKEDIKADALGHHRSSKSSTMEIDVESVVDDTKSHDDNDNKNSNNNNDLSDDIFERMSQPLDVAIAQSISTYVTTISEGWEFTGSNSRKEKDIEDRIRKIYSSILVIGGGGMIPGLSKMIEDRVSHWLHVFLPQGILNSAIQNEIKNEAITSDDKRRTGNKKGSVKGVQQRKGLGGSANSSGNGTAIISPTVITSPRDMDSRVLTWKGASILSKLDCASEMWVGANEWTNGGIKGCYKWLFPWE